MADDLKFDNFAKGTISGSHTTGVTAINLVAGHGDRFTNSPRYCVIWESTAWDDPADAFWDSPSRTEIIKQLTDATANQLPSVARAQQGTTALDMTDTGKTFKIIGVASQIFFRQQYNVANVKQYGAKGDGVTIDTAAIQATIDDVQGSGGTVFFPPGTYLSGNLQIGSTSRMRITGHGAKIKWTGSAQSDPRWDPGVREPNLGLEVGIDGVGTIDDLTIDSLEFEGSAVEAEHHAGPWTFSGLTINRLKVKNCYIHDCSIGVSITVGGGGSINDLVYEQNHIANIVGTDPGEGYGLHHGGDDGATGTSRVRIVDNFIDDCERHGIYQSRGHHVVIEGNIITNHRSGITPSVAVRSALVISRSRDVTCVGNLVDKAQDTAISIEPSSDDPTGGRQRIVCTGNVVSNYQNNTEIIRIGSGTPSAAGFARFITFADNIIQSDGSANGVTDKPALRLSTGKDVIIARNHFICLNVNDTNYLCVQIDAVDETSGTTTYTDRLVFEGNHFTITKTGGLAHAFGLTTTFCESGINTKFFNNTFNVPDLEFWRAVTITNPNIEWAGQELDSIGTPATVVPYIVAELKLGLDRMLSNAGPEVLMGTGAPTADSPKGSIFLRSDGGTDTSLYVKEATGGGGWVAK